MQSTNGNGSSNILAQLSGLRLSDGSSAGERIRVVSTPPSVEKKGVAIFGGAPPATPSDPSTPAAASPSGHVSDVSRLLSSGVARLASPPPKPSPTTASPSAAAPATSAVGKATAAGSGPKAQEDKAVSVPKPRSEVQGGGKGEKSGRQSAKAAATAAAQPSSPPSTSALNPKIAEFFSKHGALGTTGAVPVVSVSAIAVASPNKKISPPVAVVGVMPASPTGAQIGGSSGAGTAAEAGPPAAPIMPTAEDRRAAMRANQFLADAFGPVDNLGSVTPIIRSLPKLPAGGRYVIVGDVHGCVDQLEALVEKVKYEKGRDCLVIIGDYVNKGPDSVGTVQACMKHGALGILGNHDYTLLECIERGRQKPFRAEEMRDPVKRLAVNFPLECEYYLRGLPHVLKLPEYNVILVHAGLNVQHALLEHQNVYELMHLRRLEKVVTPNPQNHKKEVVRYQAVVKGSAGVPWGEVWAGPERVIFGHDAKGGFQDHPNATGIDTGCVYGDPLTCVVFSPASPQGEFFNVPGLPKRANELKGLPPPDSALYEQLQIELERQMIRPMQRSTPSLGAGSPLFQRPVFLSTPLSQAGPVGSPLSLTGPRATTSAIPSAGRLTPSTAFPTSRVMTPTTTAGTHGAREVQKASLLALAAAHELSALSVLLSLQVYENSLEAMQASDADDSAAIDSFWVPFIRQVLDAVRVHLTQSTDTAVFSPVATSSSSPGSPTTKRSSTDEVLHYALGVCDDLEAVRRSVQAELKALQDPALDEKLRRSAKKYLALLIR